MSSDDSRRRAILDAALACFLQYGYSKTSLDDVAKRAQLSRPLLYKKFRNKEAIFAALYDEMYEVRYPRIVTVVEGKGPKRSKLERACEIILIEPWELVCRAPAAAEFYTACEHVIPEILEKHDRMLQALCTKVLGDATLAEVFLLAVEGLYTDVPDVPTLRARLHILIERFT